MVNSKNHLVGLASQPTHNRKDGSNVVKGHFHSQPMFISNARIAKITIDVWHIYDSSSESSSPTDGCAIQIHPIQPRMEMPLNLYPRLRHDVTPN